jgi:hypothetical protein
MPLYGSFGEALCAAPWDQEGLCPDTWTARYESEDDAGHGGSGPQR